MFGVTSTVQLAFEGNMAVRQVREEEKKEGRIREAEKCSDYTRDVIIGL